MCYQVLLQTWTQRNRKHLQNFSKPTETVFCQGPRPLGGLRHFQKEESQLKMNLAAEGPQFQKSLKMSLESGILCVRLTVGMIEEELNLNHTTVHQILTSELKMRKICAKIVPKKPFSVSHFLASKNIPVVPQPPYSPDLSPCDLFLFPKLKNHLKGHHFGTLENIQAAVTDQLKAIPISEFHQCYEEWKKRLQRCVASEGSYFEGDNVEL
ncbi:putative transposase [Trichonephila clavipes]|nr:putative transposase [Trichonephila clavipes]